MTAPIRHLLLDIEGTTCPVRFVSETLFPYAAARLESFLETRQEDPSVQKLLNRVAQAWRHDPHPEARALLTVASSQTTLACQVLPYLHWLIRQDRKLTPLKELQGMLWEEGYGSGDLQGPLYPDVAPALRRWRAAGLELSVYSSGSVKAQQLIYGHSNEGDLRSLFQHWFDTRIGSKLEATSYERIVAELNIEAAAVLFISDSIDELQAASACGLAVLLCDRQESSHKQIASPGFLTIHSFAGLDPLKRDDLLRQAIP